MGTFLLDGQSASSKTSQEWLVLLFGWTGSGKNSRMYQKGYVLLFGRKPGPTNSRNIPASVRFCCLDGLPADKQQKRAEKGSFLLFGRVVRQEIARTSHVGLVHAIWMGEGSFLT